VGSRGSDRERRDAQNARIVASIQREQRQRQPSAAAIERAQAAQEKAEAEAEAERLTHDVRARAAELREVLRDGVTNPSAVTAAPAVSPARPFDPSEHPPKQPAPRYQDHVPPERAWDSIRPSRKRRAAISVFQALLVEYEEWNELRLAPLRRQHDGAERQRIAHEEGRRAEFVAIVDGYTKGDPLQVEQFLTCAVERSRYPSDVPVEVEVVYQPESGTVFVNRELPGLDIVPATTGYKIWRRKLKAAPLLERERHAIYRRLISGITLRTIYELFTADTQRRVTSIGVNAHRWARHSATGHLIKEHLRSAVIARDAIEGLELAHVDPTDCLTDLGARISPHPLDRETVEPLFEPDLSRYRFISDLAVAATLDNRTILTRMSWEKFEQLVRELFVAMGYEVRNTERSADGGVDAVAVYRTPAAAVVSVIQAKRYRRRVSPAAVRELAGAMDDHRASHGWVVTTSSFGPESYRFSRDHGRIKLIAGDELRSMLRQHLGMEALVDPPTG
jgi:restriction system protein